MGNIKDKKRDYTGNTDVALRRSQNYALLVGNKDPKIVVNGIYTQVADHYFDIAAVLFHMKENNIYQNDPAYKGENHSKWKVFVDKELPLGYRTVQYWLNIYQYFTDMDIGKERLEKIGWTKAKLLVNATKDPGELESLMTKAETMNDKQLKNEIQTIKTKLGPDSRETLKLKKFIVALPEASADTVNNILEAAMNFMPDTEKSMTNAVTKIFIEWFQMSLPELVKNGYVMKTDPDTGEGGENKTEGNTDVPKSESLVPMPLAAGAKAKMAAKVKTVEMPNVTKPTTVKKTPAKVAKSTETVIKAAIKTKGAKAAKPAPKATEKPADTAPQNEGVTA